jgi:hypothetical protein
MQLSPLELRLFYLIIYDNASLQVKHLFNFALEIAQTGDILDNATVPLPEGRNFI